MAKNIDILGSGWQFPPQFDQQRGQTAMVAAEENVRQSIQIILTTQLEERLFRSQFGVDLQQFVFAQVDEELERDITGIIFEALSRFEPRISIDNVELFDDESLAGLLYIHLEYTLLATQQPGNLVLPLDLNGGNVVTLQ